MWITTYGFNAGPEGATGIPTDPFIGDTGKVFVSEPYKIQAYAAMWRLAKARVEDLQYFHPPATIGMATPLVKALMTYIIACGSITIAPVGNGSSKNCFPQLPKTSPASIARAIAGLEPAALPYFAQLVTAGGLNIQHALTVFQQLRTIGILAQPPGNLPNGAPKQGLPFGSYKTNAGDLINPPNIPANLTNVVSTMALFACVAPILRVHHLCHALLTVSQCP